MTAQPRPALTKSIGEALAGLTLPEMRRLADAADQALDYPPAPFITVADRVAEIVAADYNGEGTLDLGWVVEYNGELSSFREDAPGGHECMGTAAVATLAGRTADVRFTLYHRLIGVDVR